MIEDINGVKSWIVPEVGPMLGSGESANDLIGESYGLGVEMMVLPVARLDPEFFRLASGLAGEFIQKLQNYGYRLAVVGDISERIDKSKPLADFVRETNRRGYHVFAADEGDLRAKLRAS